MKRQYITRGQYAAQVTTTVTPQERNRVAVQFHDRGGRCRRRSRASTSSATKAFTEAQLLLRDAAHHAGLVHLVHEERPVLEAEALRRPRDAAQLLPEPRLSRVQHRVDAGVDHAGQGRHLHHDQHHRRRPSTRSARSASPATCRCSGAELARADHGAARRRSTRASGCRRPPRASATASAPRATRSPTSTRCRSSTAKSTKRRSRLRRPGPARVRPPASTSPATRRPATR